MSNLWKTNQSSGAFRQVLLKIAFCVSFIGVLLGCDPTRARLASVAQDFTFQTWVWQGDHFVSVSTTGGLLQLKENSRLWTMMTTRPFLITVDSDNRVFWTTGEGLYEFPFGNPALVMEAMDDIARYLFERKEPIFLDSLKERIYLLFQPRGESAEETTTGIAILSVNPATYRSEPLLTPFFLAHPFAQIEGMDLSGDVLLIHWNLEGKRMIRRYDPIRREEFVISEEDFLASQKVLAGYQLRPSVYRMFEKIASDQRLAAVRLPILDLGSRETQIWEWGKGEDISVLGTGVQNASHLVVLVNRTLYSLVKKTGQTTVISLPFADPSLVYTNLLLGEEGYLLTWRLPVAAGQDMVGLVRLPYAK